MDHPKSVYWPNGCQVIPQPSTHPSSLPPIHPAFKLFSPSESLAPWIECYWLGGNNSQDSTIKQSSSKELFWYPDGGDTLLLNLMPAGSFSAQVTRLTQTEKVNLTQQQNQLGIHFKPGAIHYFFELNSPPLNTQLQWHQVQAFYFNQTTSHTLNSAFINKINELLLHQLEQRKLLFKRDDWFSYVRNPHQLHDIKALGSSGRRRLERQFQQFIGCSPAQLRILQQVKSARLSLKTALDIELVEVAHRSGFYDQAHFHRHFRQITGQTPGHYRARQQR